MSLASLEDQAMSERAELLQVVAATSDSVLGEPQNGLPPLLMRRMKSEILTGLPGKHVHPYRVEMPAAQADAYRGRRRPRRGRSGSGSGSGKPRQGWDARSAFRDAGRFAASCGP